MLFVKDYIFLIKKIMPKAACISNSKLFEHLTESEIQLFRDNSREVQFRKGETIFKQGTKTSHLVSLTSGIGKVYKESGTKNFILYIASSVKTVGMITTFSQIYNYSFAAITPVTVCLIDIDIFKKVLLTNQKLLLACADELSFGGVFMINRTTTIAHKQMSGRVADSLLYLSDMVYKTNSFSLDLSRQELADLSALSKETTIRVLKSFKEMGLINISGKQFTILNSTKLKQVSEKG